MPLYLKVWFTTHFGVTNWRHRPLGIMVHSLAFRTGVPWNESGFSNAEFDEVLSKAEMTVDMEERRALMERLEQILQDEARLRPIPGQAPPPAERAPACRFSNRCEHAISELRARTDPDARRGGDGESSREVCEARLTRHRVVYSSSAVTIRIFRRRQSAGTVELP